MRLLRPLLVLRREFPSRRSISHYYSCSSVLRYSKDRPLTRLKPSSCGSTSSFSLLQLLSRGCASASYGSLPPLMKGYRPLAFPQIINLFQPQAPYLDILPYMDRGFSHEEFDRGARQAVHLISTKLSNGDLEDLEDLIEPSALSQIKRNLAEFSVSQRELLSLAVENIYSSFPRQVEVILPDPPQTIQQYAEGTQAARARRVEITMVFDALRGRSADQKTSLPLFEFHRRYVLCNYGFLMDFTEGKDPSWIVNRVNHFMRTSI